MPGFTEIFGGGTIYPSEPTYLSLDISDDIVLEWPIEQAVSGDVVAKIIDVVASVAGLTITIPDARQVSTGYTALFNNVGAETVTVVNATGGTIISLTSGTAWTIYLTDNSTEAGTWRTFQQGASTSVADAAALAGAGLVAILTTLNLNWPVTTRAANYVILDSDRARVNEWIGGSGTFTLPTAVSVGSGWFTIVKNLGSGDLTVSPPSGTIDGLASLTVGAGDSCFVESDGANYFTIGLSGSTSSSSFQFIEIDVTGSGTYTLSGAELNKIGYRFIGVLSGTRNIVVPAAVQEYWVNNETTGAFSLFVKTAAQITGIEILQGDSNILYCDGTDVVSAESSTVSFPIIVSQGGTGATTAATARTNLGGTSVGVSVFTAANAAAALSAIGGAAAAITLTAGAGLTGGGDLSANRTFAVGAGDGIVVNADDVAVGAGNGIVVAAGTVSVGAGTGIVVGAGSVAIDTAVVARLNAASNFTAGLQATSTLQVSQALIQNGVASATLTGTTSNLAIGTTTSVVSLTTDTNATRLLTGMADGSSGRTVLMTNRGDPATKGTITISHEDGSSSATNRFWTPGGVTLSVRSGGGVQAYWDANVSRWVILQN